jgi:hypothetical protein
VSTRFTSWLPRALAFALLIVIGVLAPGPAHAESGDLKRSTIMIKALSFDLDLDTRIGDALVIAIVHKPGDAASQAVAASWAQAFAQLGSVRVRNAPVRAVVAPFDPKTLDDLVRREGVDVLLACDGLDVDPIIKFAQPRKLLTMGTQRAFIDAGLMFGVFYEEDRPRIVANHAAMLQGGFRFSSAMLRLAILVKGKS